MQGGGIALGRSSLAARLRHAGQLIAPFDLEVPIAEAFYLLQPADGVAHGDAGLFADWLLDQVAADRDDADISRTTG
jgi:LysR family transcriptional regulator, glycine cleavage system transcriptional activator